MIVSKSIVVFLFLANLIECSSDFLDSILDQDNQIAFHNLHYKNTKKRNLQSTAASCGTSSSYTSPPFIVNPLAISLYSKEQIKSSKNQLELDNIIFDFNAQSIANITVDIRQMYYYNQSNDKTQLTYGQDWQYCILLNTTLNKFDCSAGCLELPQTFIQQITLNVNIHKFSLYSMTDQKLTVLALINNPKYASLRLNLLNTVTIGIIQPQRANYNQDVSFAFYISSTSIAVPVNSIPLSRQSEVSNYLLSYEQNYFNKQVINNTNLTGNPSTTTPSQYYLSLNGMFMPYMPYFSNCRSFGDMGFLYEITENPDKCKLVEPQDVKVINQFKFGDKPISDECDNIQYDCVLDEYLNYNFITNTWLQQNIRTTIFQMTPNPIQLDQTDLNSQSYSSNYLANVLTLNVIPSGKLPTKIVFKIGYYQVTPTQKQIIIGNVWFENFITPSTDQVNGVVPFNYQLDFSFHSMNQSELTINFALSIWVYIFMYMICGSVSLASVCVFTGYHLLFRRMKSKIQTNIKQCLKVFYPGAIFGIYLPLIPVAIILTLALLLMGGQMWQYPFNLYNCNPQVGNCQLSIFDTMTNLSLSDSNLSNLRKGRFGLCLLVIGIYIMIVCADLLVPKKKNQTDEKTQQVSFDGNVWFKRMWEKSKFLLFYFVVVIIMEIIIYWSLSNNFGANTWYYLCTLKILGMIFERFGIIFFSKFILSSPIAFAMDHILDVATLGANDFLQFLLSFFIEQGIQMYERTYVNIIVEEVEDFIWEAYCELKAILFTAWEKYQSEDNFDNSDAFSIGVREEIDKISDSNSSIMLSENFEESIDSNFIMDDCSVNIPKEVKTNASKKLQQDLNNIVNQQQKSVSFEDSSKEEIDHDEFEKFFRDSLQYKKDKEQYERIKRQESKRDYFTKKQKEQLQRRKHQQKQEIDTTSFECIERYAEFFTGMLGPFLLPVITLQSWLFYNQIDLANNYNIQQQFFVVYFFYTLIILPFRVAIDIVYYHLWIVYHDIDFLPYATKCKQRFENRRNIWKAEQTTSESDDDQNSHQGINENEKSHSKHDEESEDEQEFKDIDKWCFSSQFYFVSSLFLIGMMQCVLGLYEITFTNYRLFADTMLVPIILLWVFLCFVVHKFCMFLGKISGLWKIKKKQDNNQAQNNTNDEQPKSQSNQQEEQEDDVEKKMELQNKKIFDISEKEKQKEKQKIFQKRALNLQKTQFENQNFRKNFILSNKQWLRRNIKDILDKDTKKQYRDVIIEQMENIDVKLQKRRNMKKFLLQSKLKRIKNTSFIVDNNEDYEEAQLIENKKQLKRLDSQKRYQDDQSDIEFDILYDIYQQDLRFVGERRDSFSKFEATVQPNRPTEIPNTLKIILKYWLYRSRNLTKACSLVGGIFDRNIKKYCQFCGNQWGLICQSEQNTEDLYQMFIKSKKLKSVITDKQKDSWQEFFQENCSFRTECLECNQIMQQEFFKQLKIKQQIEKAKKELTKQFDNKNSNPLFNFLQLNNELQFNSVLENLNENNYDINKQALTNILPNNNYNNEGKTNINDYNIEKRNSQYLEIKQNSIRNKYIRQNSINRQDQKSNNSLQNSYDLQPDTQLNTKKIPFFTLQTIISNIYSQSDADAENDEEQKQYLQEPSSGKYYLQSKNSQNQRCSHKFEAQNFSDFEKSREISQKKINFEFVQEKLDDEEQNQQNTEREMLTNNY